MAKAKKTNVVSAISSDGTPSAQVTALSAEIIKLTEHLKANPKDYSSRRGLLKKVGRRKSLMRYLQTNDVEAYKTVALANNLKTV